MDSSNYKNKDFEIYQQERQNREHVLQVDNDEEMMPEVVN